MSNEKHTWVKQPAIDGRQQACLHAGVAENLFPDDAVIAVGFGYAGVHRDGNPVYTEPHQDDDEDFWTGAVAEKHAAADPDHDWQIVLEGPLSGRTYQRHGVGRWVLVQQNQGFA